MGSPPTPAPAADSATVIVLRERGAACDVLLLERHAESRAFAGAHVFPGGRVDEADRDPVLQAACGPDAGAAAAAALADGTPPEVALAFCIAAIRELFEEAGVLLAWQAGHAVRLDAAPEAARFAAHRAALHTGALSFADLVARERLVLRTDGLAYFSRWITPVQAPRRYDARFFVALLPEGQEPLHDALETTGAAWWAPAEAVARAGAGSLSLTPPTLRILDELDELGSAARIVAAARARRVVPILPRMTQLGGQAAVLFPGDAAYGDPAAAASATGPLDRALMENGTWRIVRSGRGS